tara:strand:+ start:2768 stop:5242 length:2475 start_codon:yes stop_codon:yes gene_type:complete
MMEEAELLQELKRIAAMTESGTIQRNRAVTELAKKYRPDEDLKQTKKFIRENLKGLGQGSKEPTNETLRELLKSKPVTRRGKALAPSDMIRRKLDEDMGITFKNENYDVSSASIQDKILAYADTLEGNEQENLRKNFDVLVTAYKSIQRKKTRKLRIKTIKIDIDKYIGANALSKASIREGIYDHWADVNSKYPAFKEALDNLIEASIGTVEGYSPLVFETPIFEEKGGSKFIAKMKKIQDEYSDKNLEYVYKFDKISAKAQENPVHRLLDALIRIESAENLNQKVKAKGQNYDDDETSGDEGWGANYLGEIEGAMAESGGDIEEEEGDDGDGELDRINQVLSRVEGSVDTDPLLAYEVTKGTKLIALEEKSEQVLRESIDMIREGKGYLDFQTHMDKLLDQLEDSITLDREEYLLPASILTDKVFIDLMETGVESGSDDLSVKSSSNLADEIVDEVGELFSDLHEAFTDERFGFEGAVRTTTSRARTKVTTQREADKRRQRRSPRIDTIISESQRMRPISPATRGKMKQGLESLEEPFENFFKAFNEYYVTPLYVGKTPVNMPDFTNNEGYKALNVLAKDMGIDTVLGSAYEQLASEGRATIKADTLGRLIGFLETLAQPKVLVDNDMKIKAINASQALSEIFGNDEDNYDYFAAVLKHYMELTNNFEILNKTMRGSTVDERAKRFEENYGTRTQAYSIFALPQYLEMNQGLLTRKDSIKKNYRKLISLLKQVESDLPVILKRLLEAHDAIRKQLGKKVSYGFLTPTFDSYDKVISKMETSEQIDLSHLEVENIVKAVDSHNNISKEYGITEEQVYLIKSSFR